MQPFDLIHRKLWVDPTPKSLIPHLLTDAGGATSVYIGQPLDTVKVKMQTFPALYKNASQCFMSTLRQEGIAHGLYAGTVPSLMAQVSENAVLFMAYGVCQKLVVSVAGKRSVEHLSVVQNGLAGTLSLSFCLSCVMDVQVLCHFLSVCSVNWICRYCLTFFCLSFILDKQVLTFFLFVI